MTRKIVATLMLSVLMFNMGGYFIIYRVLDVRAARLLDERIQNGDIGAQEAVEFKVTLELPYPVHEQEIETTSRVESGGIPYAITSHHYKDYTLTLVGVRDQWAQHVNTVMEAFNKAANGESDTDMSLISGLTLLAASFEQSCGVALAGSDAWIRTLNFANTEHQLLTVSIAIDPGPPRA